MEGVKRPACGVTVCLKSTPALSLKVLLFNTYRPGGRNYRDLKCFSSTECGSLRGKKVLSHGDFLRIIHRQTECCYIGHEYQLEFISNIIIPERNSWKEDELVTPGELSPER